jgi:hypothetical protein
VIGVQSPFLLEGMRRISNFSVNLTLDETSFLKTEAPNKIRKNTQSQSIRPVHHEPVNLDESTEMTRDHHHQPLTTSSHAPRKESLSPPPPPHASSRPVQKKQPSEQAQNDSLFLDEVEPVNVPKSLPVKRPLENEDEDEIFMKAAKKAKRNIPSTIVSQVPTSKVPPVPLFREEETPNAETQETASKKVAGRRTKKSDLLEESEGEEGPKEDIKTKQEVVKDDEEDEDYEDKVPVKGKGKGKGSKPATAKSAAASAAATKRSSQKTGAERIEDDFFAVSRGTKRNRDKLDFDDEDQQPSAARQKINSDSSKENNGNNLVSGPGTSAVFPEEEIPRKFIDATDWTEVTHGLKNILLEKKLLHEDNLFEEPVVEERNLLRNDLPPPPSTSSSTATSATTTTKTSKSKKSKYAAEEVVSSNNQNPEGAIRNVKKFVKNFIIIASPSETISYRKMDKVLPKESEREIQVRKSLEFNLIPAFNHLCSFDWSSKHNSNKIKLQKKCLVRSELTCFSFCCCVLLLYLFFRLRVTNKPAGAKGRKKS